MRTATRDARRGRRRRRHVALLGRLAGPISPGVMPGRSRDSVVAAEASRSAARAASAADRASAAAASAAASAPSLRSFGFGGGAAQPAQRVAEVAQRLGELARDHEDLVRLALGELRQHLQVLVGEQLLVGLARRGSREDGLDRLRLALGAQDRRRAGALGAAAPPTASRPRR